MGHRKLWASFLVLVLVTVLMYLDKLTGAEYVEVIKFLLGSFAVANGAEHIGRGMSNAK